MQNPGDIQATWRRICRRSRPSSNTNSMSMDACAVPLLVPGRPMLTLSKFARSSCSTPAKMACSTYRPVLFFAQRLPSVCGKVDFSSADRFHRASDCFQLPFAAAYKSLKRKNREQRRDCRTSAAASGPSAPAGRRNERDGSDTASSSGRWEIPGRGELEYKWLIEGGEKGPVKGALSLLMLSFSICIQRCKPTGLCLMAWKWLDERVVQLLGQVTCTTVNFP